MEKKFELVYNKEYKTIFVRCGNQTFVPEQLLQKPPALPDDVEGRIKKILCAEEPKKYSDNCEKTCPAGDWCKQALAQILSLYPQMASEEEIRKSIEDILRTTPIAGDFDRTKAIFANETIIDKLAHALVGKVAKPALTEEELEEKDK